MDCFITQPFHGSLGQAKLFFRSGRIGYKDNVFLTDSKIYLRSRLFLRHERKQVQVHAIGNDRQIPVQLGTGPFRLDNRCVPDVVDKETDGFQFRTLSRETAQNGYDHFGFQADTGQGSQISAGRIMSMDHVRFLPPDPMTDGTDMLRVPFPSMAYDRIQQHIQSFFFQGIILGLDERAYTSARLVSAGDKKDSHRIWFQYHSQAAAKPARASNLG